MSSWTDQFVGDRMAVDRAFSERVAASEFSSQEWGTIMTAVELEIENPESADDARLVADTSQVEQVLPALEEMRQSMPGAGGAASGTGGGGSGRGASSGRSGGLLQSIKRSLGLGGGADEQRAEAATALADEYARQFQDHLEERGKWERACDVAASSHGDRGVENVGDGTENESGNADADATK